ncbi:MAG: tRNA (adenine(58)-N(1))-methyltransferase non-catalytic subunit trm6 [Cyphobasidiales sp. Tagirdzhanova-0007]|nr:MAG: tRNA (adenine(58)-N(1))-methyltransferase non-catalytic subunit trm6 [Cyphobasidiales sp. Tagirdzhanova-0007]
MDGQISQIADTAAEPADAPELPIASTSDIPPATAPASPRDSPPSSSTKLSLSRDRSRIGARDVVMLQLPSESTKLVKLAEHFIINLGKYGAFPVSQLIGQPYGVTLEILPPVVVSADEDDEGPADMDVVVNEQPGNQVKQKGKRKANHSTSPSKKDKARKPPKARDLCTLRRIENEIFEEIEETDATNELIKATGAKTLSQEEILDMKRQGVSGKEIIERQIAEHEAFALKNEYSKAKYKALKRSKYLKIFVPLPPTVHNVCQYYFQLEPKKIRDLRPDTLAQMMALGNVRPGARVLVVDETSGLLTGAVAERLGGQGMILVLHPNDSPPANPLLPLLNLPPSFVQKDVLRDMHWGYTEASWPSLDLPIDPLDEQNETEHRSERERNRLRKRKAALEYHSSTLKEWADGEFDALLVASQYETLSIINVTLPALAGSAQIVVHSPIFQTLSDALQSLIPMPTVLNPTLIEPWLRQYQVLPGRTHPVMNGVGHGGFLLHATRVFDEVSANSARSAGIGLGNGGKNKRRKR